MGHFDQIKYMLLLYATVSKNHVFSKVLVYQCKCSYPGKNNKYPGRVLKVTKSTCNLYSAILSLHSYFEHGTGSEDFVRHGCFFQHH